MSPQEKKTCGDYGGELFNGDPCTKPAGFKVRGRSDGKCYMHAEDTEKENDTGGQTSGSDNSSSVNTAMEVGGGCMGCLVGPIIAMVGIALTATVILAPVGIPLILQGFGAIGGGLTAAELANRDRKDD